MDTATAIELAVQAAGGQSALARKLAEMTGHGFRQGHVWKWLNGSPVMAEACLPIEQLTGVSRHHLRPDIFGPPPAEAEAAAG